MKKDIETSIPNTVLEWIQNSKMNLFTFDELWKSIKQFPETKYHNYDGLRKIVIEMLEKNPPELEQVIVDEYQLDSNDDDTLSAKREKVIAFKVER